MLPSTHFLSFNLKVAMFLTALRLAGILLYWLVALKQKLFCIGVWLAAKFSPYLIDPDAACLVSLGWAVTILRGQLTASQLPSPCSDLTLYLKCL